MPQAHRFSSSAGIAIGPILFVLALLALIAAVMASGGSGDFQTASITDRVANDIVAQANLIRNTIAQCNLQYQMAISTGSVLTVGDSYPAAPTSGLVSDMTCTPMGGSPPSSLWGAILLPQPTAGFSPWKYYTGGDSGGRCIVATPTAKSSSVSAGLIRAASKFNSTTNYSSSSPSEVLYNSTSSTQNFVVVITTPSSGTFIGNCSP